MPNPIISGTIRDRTGSAAIMRRAVSEIRRRYSGLQADVLAIFDRIPVYQLNAEFGQVAYGMTAEQMQLLNDELAAAFERWIVSGKDAANVFWYGTYDSEANQLGAAQSNANLANLSEAYAATRPIQSIIYSTPYKNRLAMAQIKSMEHWTGLAATQKSELTQIIGRAVVDGKNPKAVRTEIMERMDVSRSKAAQYSQTDITDTLRQAKWAETDDASESLNLKIGLLWTSALLPTTRPNHASRNGKVYTTEEVRVFYSSNGERYNCYLPGTLVSGRFVAGSKARYKGPIVTLVTAGGRELTVTANHPVMTSSGLVSAAKIKVGRQLIAYGHQIKKPSGVVDLDGCEVGARIEDVFSAIVDFGHEFLAGVSGVDFNGDAAFMDEQIHVVHSNRVLTFALDATGAQFLDDLALEHSNTTRAGRGLEKPFVNAGNSSSCGGVGIGDQSFLLGGSVFPKPVDEGVSYAPEWQSEISEATCDVSAIKSCSDGYVKDGFTGEMGGMKWANNGSSNVRPVLIEPKPSIVKPGEKGAFRNPDSLAKVLDRFAGLASLDEVVDVRFGYFDGHVYDLQEVSGLMISNSITASNCHCGQTQALLDASGNAILTDKLKASMLAEKQAWEKSQAKESTS